MFDLDAVSDPPRWTNGQLQSVTLVGRPGRQTVVLQETGATIADGRAGSVPGVPLVIGKTRSPADTGRGRQHGAVHRTITRLVETPETLRGQRVSRRVHTSSNRPDTSVLRFPLPGVRHVGGRDVNDAFEAALAR